MRIACVDQSCLTPEPPAQDGGVAAARNLAGPVQLTALQGALRDLGCEVVMIEEPRNDRLRAQLECVQQERPIDLVYERYAKGADAGSRFCAAFHVPHVLELDARPSLDDPDLRGHDASEQWRRELCRRELEVLRCARAVVCGSSKLASYAIERGARPSSVLVQPNAVDTRRFHPRRPDDALRRELVPHGRVALGFHGRLRPWHGLDLVALAVAELLREGADLHMLLVGEGEFDALFTGLVPRHRVTRIGFHAHVDVARAIACFDVLALGSVRNQPYYFSPLKLCEAMASGVVPVVPRSGDLPSIVSDGIDGACYTPGDVADLVRALRPLVMDADVRSHVAAAAIERSRCTSWRDVARTVIGLLCDDRLGSDQPRGDQPRGDQLGDTRPATT